MNIPNNRKSKLVYLLALVALVVWGHNGYQILLGLRQSDGTEMPEAGKWNVSPVLDDSLKAAGIFIYQAAFRDPFLHWLSEPAPKVAPKINSPKPVTIIQRPNIRLIGILKDKSGPLAVIEDARQQTQFVREGELIEGITLVKIDSNWVECRMGKERFRLRIVD